MGDGEVDGGIVVAGTALRGGYLARFCGLWEGQGLVVLVDSLTSEFIEISIYRKSSSHTRSGEYISLCISMAVIHQYQYHRSKGTFPENSSCTRDESHGNVGYS